MQLRRLGRTGLQVSEIGFGAWGIGGTMWIGADSSGDKNRTVAVPNGGFVRDIAQGIHYDGSGNDPMWIQIAGVGPTATTNVDPAK